jgi:hypothetical protein
VKVACPACAAACTVTSLRLACEACGASFSPAHVRAVAWLEWLPEPGRTWLLREQRSTVGRGRQATVTLESNRCRGSKVLRSVPLPRSLRRIDAFSPRSPVFPRWREAVGVLRARLPFLEL